jgi:hypothetical protein
VGRLLGPDAVAALNTPCALADGDEMAVLVRRAGVGGRARDRHLAAQRGVRRLERDDFDDPLVRHELDEAAVLPVPAGASSVSETRAGPGTRGPGAGCATIGVGWGLEPRPREEGPQWRHAT